MTILAARRALALTGPALFALGLLAMPAAAGENGKPVGLHTHRVADATYFAVQLRADGLAAPALPRDHVVLVDTSASQIGEHRQQLLAVLDAFLASLPQADRVCLFAVDVRPARLTAEFAAPGSAELAEAVARLRERAPLGATDLMGALRTAGAALDGARSGSIVYLGDGMSAASLVRTADLAEQSREFRERQVPVHSYAAGPNLDLRVLGTLALQTGGVVLFDNAGALAADPETKTGAARRFAERQVEAQAPATVGRKLAEAADAPVFYPARIAAPEGALLLPAVALPLRQDRSTIYIGTGAAAGEISVSGNYGDLPLELAWDLSAAKVQASGNAVLYPLWTRAERDAGLSVSLAGEPLLRASQDAFDVALAALLAEGERAVALRNAARAEEIGLAVLAVDPENVAAKALVTAAANQRKPGASRVLVVAQAEVPPAPGEPGPSVLDEFAPRPGRPVPPDFLPGSQPPRPPGADLIAEQEEIVRIRTEQLRVETNRAMEQARQVAVTDPVGARLVLEQQLVTIEHADIFPEVRRDLKKILQGRISQYKLRADAVERERVLLAEKQAQLEAQRRLIEQMTIEEERIAQLVDQVRALLEEGVHGNDDAYEQAELVAEVVVNMQPGLAVAEAARFTAEAAGQLNKAFKLRQLRHDRFLETLYQVELSHVPFPDEPPIRFPPAEVWQALTERRRKWASVDLHKHSPREERIIAALRENTEIEFADTPLEVAMQVLADLHGITIILDKKGLEEEQIALDTPVNRVLSGISLRSGLKILLEEFGLTYVIRNEVMEITTELKAADIMSTRVYPVGDLVIPIPQNIQAQLNLSGVGSLLGGLGGGGLGGGLGGLGGGLGGLGGGLGGGFGGGLGGGGIGGGLFSVAPELPHAPDAVIPRPDLRKLPQAQRNGQGAGPNAAEQDAEVESILNGILGSETSQAAPRAGQFFAQVRDLPFDNRSIEEAAGKKKLPTAR
ncbi:MAG: hypothetical protein WD069_19245 [Planctomycetales bacterium]